MIQSCLSKQGRIDLSGENLHYDIDGDRTIWRVAVRPAHKNHAWAGIAVTSDDTIENIRVVERGGAGGSVLGFHGKDFF